MAQETFSEGRSFRISEADLQALKARGVVRTISLRDNTRFIKKFDVTKFLPAAKAAKTVVVDQDPDAGEFVPSGTPIDITLTTKDVIPLESFTDIDPLVLNKYKNKNIGDLLGDLEKDELGKEAKSVLEKKENTDYDALSTSDKQRVNNFIKNRFALDPDAEANKEKVTNIYDNFKFLNDV